MCHKIGSQGSSCRFFPWAGGSLDLQRLEHLPGSAASCWPVAAREAVSPYPLEQLSVQERRILSILSVAGGSLDLQHLSAFFPSDQTTLQNLLQRLVLRGHIRRESDHIVALLPPSKYLKRFRKSQLKKIAATLLPLAREEPEVRHRAALFAGDRRLAAAISLRIAREKAASDENASMHWYWVSFRLGARPGRRLLFGMIRHWMLRGRGNRASKLLRHWRTRFGGGYRWADQVLHLLHRTNRTKSAIELARKAIRHAAKNNPNAFYYFSARRAGFLLMERRLAEAENILTELVLRYSILKKRTQGLTDHCSALLFFYRGNPSKSISLARRALKQPHPLRSTGLLNIGIFYSRAGKLDRGERYLRKSMEVFVRRKDRHWLSQALNNLGLVLKQKGEIEQARQCYTRSVHLSRAVGNQANVAAALENIAVTYSLQGRTSMAIRYHHKAATVAVKAGLDVFHSYTLTNIGLQYAILGRFVTAFGHLKKAAEIRKKHGLLSNLAGTLEYLGIAFLLAKQHGKALRNFRASGELFQEGGLRVDGLRVALYAALVPGVPLDLQSLSAQASALQPDSFEQGLWKYVEARATIDEEDRERCRLALHEAERIFRKVPSLFWLAAVHELKASYYRKVEHLEKAALSLQAASNIYLQLGARKSLLNLAKGAKDMKLQQGLLDRMMEKLPFKMLVMVRDILKEKNPEKMISKILSTALEFTDMERAVLILAENPPKIFRSTSLDEETIREIFEISTSALESASTATRPFVCLNASQDDTLKAKNSILANRITSVVCLPLWSGEQLMGYLYLDSREGVETLVETETVLLEIFGSIIAIALDTNLILEKSLEEIEGYRSSLGINSDHPEMIGNSKPIQEVMKKAQPLIASDIAVLITGETGTGKDLIARILHYCGKRKEGPFVTLNCSALSESLLENELFGHEKGAFTGAFEQRKGLFEQAGNGTLFLDEVGDMPRAMQSKLLRVLQDGEFRRIGGSRTLHTNARIVLATNRDVDQLMRDNDFRKDLYYRITGAEIRLPPLRERKEDIPLLAAFFLKPAKAAARKKIRGFLPETMEVLKAYPWPGNVRELKKEIERIVAYIDHEWVLVSDLDPRLRNGANGDSPSGSVQTTLREMDREFILQRLAAHDWNIVHTARSLGLTRNGLYSKMRIYNIPRKNPAR